MTSLHIIDNSHFTVTFLTIDFSIYNLYIQVSKMPVVPNHDMENRLKFN